MTQKKWIKEYGMIMVGTFMLALSIDMFFEPNNLVTGGATGLAIIWQTVGQKLFGIPFPIWLTNLVINTPLFLIGAKMKGFSFLKRTIFATLFLSFSLYIAAFIPLDYFRTDLLLASVFGGVLSGAGVGLVISNFATTGGSDLAATLIHQHKKNLPVSKVMFVIDAIIIMLGMFIFGTTRALYAIIAIFIGAKMVSMIVEGVNFSKAALIISDCSEEIGRALLEQLERGVTSLNGQGFYTKKDKNVLICVVAEQEVTKLREIVKEIDEKAFVIMTDVREVLGEGFGNI